MSIVLDDRTGALIRCRQVTASCWSSVQSRLLHPLRVLQEPGVLLDLRDGDALQRVGAQDALDEVHTLAAQNRAGWEPVQPIPDVLSARTN